MDKRTNAMIAGMVAMAVLGFLCLVQAGCSEQRAREYAVCTPCNCDEVVRTAVEAVQQDKSPVADDAATKKQAEVGAECLVREETARKAKESQKKTEAETCDANLSNTTWMEEGDDACPFDPQKASPFRQLSAEEKLAASYVHSLRYRDSEYYFRHALECPKEKPWSKYTREQVQARYDCLRLQYHKAHKAVILYTKPLGMHFAAPGEEDYGYEPALRVVLDILRDVDRDQGANLNDFGVTVAQLVNAYQLRFKEALEFYEGRVKACKDGKDTFRDRDGVLLDQLCDLVTDGNLYADYPDPLKGVTRAEMAKRLNCRVED